MRIPQIATVRITHVIFKKLNGKTKVVRRETNKRKAKMKKLLIIFMVLSVSTITQANNIKIETVNKKDLKYSVVAILDKSDHKEIFVYTEGRGLQQSLFVDKLKRIIKRISLQGGNKISIDFFDDKKTLKMVYLSKKKFTPLNKKELSQRDKHNLASYSGGIGISSYQYTLSIWDGKGNDLIPMIKFKPKK